MNSNGSYMMTYTLNSGIKGSITFSNKQIEEWMESYRIGSKYVTTVGKVFFGLNPELVADFKVHNESSEQREHISVKPITGTNKINEQIADAYSKYETQIQVDCKCGESYIMKSAYKKTKWGCKNCGEMVFLDRKVGMVNTEQGKAWYMTNRYYIERS
ncbi:hypothetical protein [Paenibacillus polymyxa]|uniref:hypothetical protein n=1 Tax=Paenibacillus polymyxa TaxID=1406 RepID=UPI003216A049